MSDITDARLVSSEGLTGRLSKDDAEDYLQRINTHLTEVVARMPTHREFVTRRCPMRETA